MNRIRTMFAVCFLAGAGGGLMYALALWSAGNSGLTDFLGVNLHPVLTPDWLYSRVIWGALWGWCYFLFVSSPPGYKHWIRKGLWVSLVPTLLQLFYFYPHQTPYGNMGLSLGMLTPLVILAANGVWGAFTGFFTRLLWGR